MRIIFLMLICSSANAAMYSCVDESGTRILKNYPCEQNEKQQVIANEVEPSHAIIHSTGERINFRSLDPEIPIQTTTQSVAISDNRKYKQQPEDRMQRIVDVANQIANEGHPDNRTSRFNAALRSLSGMADDDSYTPSRKRKNYPQPTLIPASPPGPSVITNCDGSGCWDNLGGRYNKGGGNTYFPTTGGACQMVGGMMQCP